MNTTKKKWYHSVGLNLSSVFVRHYQLMSYEREHKKALLVIARN